MTKSPGRTIPSTPIENGMPTIVTRARMPTASSAARPTTPATRTIDGLLDDQRAGGPDLATGETCEDDPGHDADTAKAT